MMMTMIKDSTLERSEIPIPLWSDIRSKI